MDPDSNVPTHDPESTTSTRQPTSPGPVRSRIPMAPRMWIVAIALLLLAVEPASAQDAVGTVYCGTRIEKGIDMVFGAVAGLGLPATMLFMARGGVGYMRAGGRPQKKDEARDQFMMAAMGFGIIVLALTAPGIISKMGGQLGFGFSECVRPF